MSVNNKVTAIPNPSSLRFSMQKHSLIEVDLSQKTFLHDGKKEIEIILMTAFGYLYIFMSLVMEVLIGIVFLTVILI